MHAAMKCIGPAGDMYICELIINIFMEKVVQPVKTIEPDWRLWPWTCNQF